MAAGATLDMLLAMHESFGELSGMALPVFTVVLALGVARFWREGAPRWVRLRPGAGAVPWRQRTCVRPSASAYAGDFNRHEVLHAAKRRFVELQAAWDARDLERLRDWTTPEMLDQLLDELPARSSGPTEVTTLHAELLGFEHIADVCLASIEFSGTVRESFDRRDVSFREVWMLTHPVGAASEWRLARQQTLF